MTKLIEIPFDASLIGQEGIVVKTRKGQIPKQLIIFDANHYWPVCFVADEQIVMCTIKGNESNCRQSDYDLIMYREQKVMSVEEWIDKHLELGGYKRIGAEMLAAAIKDGRVEL